MLDSKYLPDSQSVFLEAGIGTWYWNADTGIFELSADAIQLLQIRDDELPLQLETILAQLHDEDIASFAERMDEMGEASGIHSADFRASLDDGSERWFRAVGQAFEGTDGAISHAAGVLLDVTDQRQAERSQSAFFEQPNGIHLIADKDGLISHANSGWQLALGYRPGELIGRNFLSLVHDDDKAATIAEMDNLAKGIKTLYFENRYRHQDGSHRLIAWSATVPEGDNTIFAIGKDITDERASQERLSQAAVVFNNSGEGIIVTDLDGTIRDVNAAFSRITGYARNEVIGRHTRLLRSGHHSDDYYEEMWRGINEEGIWRGEIWNRRKSGEAFPELLTITRVTGEPGGYIAIFTDISQIKETEEQLQRLAHYDQLTNLPNRYLINERLVQCLRRAHRRNLRLAVVFLDLDSFKNINDSLGHVAGDELLRTTAERLRNTLRDDDNIGRIGGDEFLIVMEDVKSSDDVTTIAEKLIGTLRQPMQLNGREVSVSASLGISLYPDDGQTAEVLMSNADAAMYSAKEQGRDTFRFYSERLTREAFQHVLLDSALREAQSREEFRLAFQAQRSLESGMITGMEVLLRWHHPQLGTVPPAQFIPHAERTGLIRSIGRWVLEQACRQGAHWLEAGVEFGRLAVNISAPQIRNEDFVAQVKQTLADTGLPPDRLELEITESVLLRDTDELISKMGILREMGVRFAIDDFGTGYSSLSYLRRMPIDRLKLDQSFVDGIDEDSNNRVIPAAVIALGAAMGIDVIAEGIETPAQEAVVRELGCDEVQGYLYGTPLHAQRMEAILSLQAKRAGET